MTEEEWRVERSAASDMGSNAGNCVGNIINTMLSDDMTFAEKRADIRDRKSVFEHEIGELVRIVRNVEDELRRSNNGGQSRREAAYSAPLGSPF